jgi:hypothetical protein
MMMGKTEPIKMMNPAAEAVSPNQMIANGIHARGGIGRRSSIRGSRKASKRRSQPIMIPIGMPTTSDMPRPMAKWTRLAWRSRRSVPFSTRLTNAEKTSVGAGRMNG